MTPARKKIHAAIVVLVTALAAGCAPTKPPLDELDAASRALAAARQADAPQLAAAEYRAAGRHFDQAQAAQRDEDYDAAAQLAAESLADSELALAKAKLARARAEVERLTRENEGLQGDLDSHPAGLQQEQP
ncbi:DUF4398 domain-containing protein [Dokdonella fugitiva]|uniref:Uncharacterized protein DUF4398 n=1 Tax=Dokdonella fugitiva TaxID=328517 RepID=A0A4R2IF02_9GAMM|nr:DUF4398 domain-containing protein [Dokdonella fugitiva]TCO42772.1 uncharacterized protein DUF4398 [Dokdonella fugitiva]